MSYDLQLNNPVTGEVLELDAAHHMRGGTYCQGGTTEASLNVTYNYAAIFSRVMVGGFENLDGFDKMFGGNATGIRSIYGKTGAESIPMLTAAIDKLGDDVDPNYWTATEGNAKATLIQLRALAQMRPDGVWAGD